jgi:hypothetical protein
MDQAIKNCASGIGIWEWASSEQGGEPDIAMAGAGDVPALETLASVHSERREASRISCCIRPFAALRVAISVIHLDLLGEVTTQSCRETAFPASSRG